MASMVILILEKVPTSLRGELSRWMIEPRTGVFVGTLSALVRDKLWEKACKAAGDSGGCVLVHTADNEQRFLIQTWGNTKRSIVNFEGLNLVKIPN